jgi:hypothetical protein
MRVLAYGVGYARNRLKGFDRWENTANRSIATENNVSVKHAKSRVSHGLSHIITFNEHGMNASD